MSQAFYVMGKALSGKLSCMWTGLVGLISWSSRPSLTKSIQSLWKEPISRFSSCKPFMTNLGMDLWASYEWNYDLLMNSIMAYLWTELWPTYECNYDLLKNRTVTYLWTELWPTYEWIDDLLMNGIMTYLWMNGNRSCYIKWRKLSHLNTLPY